MPEPRDPTRWLDALQAGDSAALDESVPVLYDELRRRLGCLLFVSISLGRPFARS